MRLRTLLAWLLVAPWAAWAAVRVLGLDRGWPLVGLIAFTPWVVVATAGALVVAALLRSRLPALVALLSLLALLWAVAPRAIGGDPAAGASSRPLRVLTINMLGGGADARAIAGLVRRTRADVLSAQELTPEGAQALEDAGLGELLPNEVLRARPGGRGTGIFSRLELRAAPPPSQPYFAMTAATARTGDGTDVEIVAVHPRAPSGEQALPDWRAGLASLPSASRDRIRVLAGDFNATLDHRELRKVLDRGYEDAAATAGAGLRPTWPVGRRVLPMVTIDHVLVDRRAGVGRVGVHDVPRTDHRAVSAELFLPG